jgi:hypothetical protein
MIEKIVTGSSGGGKASFTFHEIGNSQSNGTITATGAAFFDANETGNLAFLIMLSLYTKIKYITMELTKSQLGDGNDMASLLSF